MLNHTVLLKVWFENAEAHDRYLPHSANQELGRCMSLRSAITMWPSLTSMA